MLGEKEVCYGCEFYDRNVEGHCKARQKIKDRCTYWSNEKQRIVITFQDNLSKELKAEDRE